MKPKFKLAVVQIRTETDKEKTFAKAEKMISEAANNGAELVVLPEMWNCPYSKKYFHAFADSENGESRSRATGKCICLTSISRAECALKSPTALHPARISPCSIRNSAEWALRYALISAFPSLREPWPKGEPRSFCALRSSI